MSYLYWKEEVIKDFSPGNITRMYEAGFLFTRKGKGLMQQTRSCRIALARFEPSSENRRIMKKTADLLLAAESLPLAQYDFKIAKLGKDFYDAKFDKGVMSAQKIKEMLTEQSSNFNILLKYKTPAAVTIGYAICHENQELLHYSYPFYDLSLSPKDMGLGMMLRAVEYAKQQNHNYIYLGSLQRPGDRYKLQFAGLEWFDGSAWQTDDRALRDLLK